MPIVPPYALPLLLVFACTEIFILARLPARPHSVLSFVLWGLGFLLIGAIEVWGTFSPRDIDVWKEPAWHPFLTIVALFVVPFGTSALLCLLRRKPRPAIGVVASTVIVIAAAILPHVAIITFNRTCVFFDYHHDDGTAWCPADWQANWG